MTSNKVPKATLQRYPVYLKALRKLKASGRERIMSKELADYVGIESTTIRRDFSFLGKLGKQGYGYDVESLINIFSEELGVNFAEKIILVGCGNLGKALLNYNNWNHVVGEIVCAFDIAPEKVEHASVLVADLIISIVLGVVAFSSFWSILEIFQQHKRVEKGWFPAGPGHSR